MDVPREGVAAKKRKRRILIISASAVGLILATFALSRLKPAAPSVDRSSVWIDTVKRGPMVGQVRGFARLVQEDFVWLPRRKEEGGGKFWFCRVPKVEPGVVFWELSRRELE